MIPEYQPVMVML